MTGWPFLSRMRPTSSCVLGGLGLLTGREDDALVVNRVGHVGTLEELVERRADVLVGNRECYVAAQGNILRIVEEGVSALILDLLHDGRDGCIGDLKRDGFLLCGCLCLRGVSCECKRQSQRQSKRSDCAEQSVHGHALTIFSPPHNLGGKNFFHKFVRIDFRVSPVHRGTGWSWRFDRRGDGQVLPLVFFRVGLSLFHGSG